MTNEVKHTAVSQEDHFPVNAEPHEKKAVSVKSILRGFESQLSPRYLQIDFAMLVWIFVIASFLGLVIEDVYHIIAFGEYESRAGLVWGPFSSIYGLGAVLLTIFLNRFYYTHNIVVFLLSMVLGATLEFGASWMMETFWHAIAWDYTGTFGSIAGRTNFLFGMMWGALGLFWVRFALPVMKQLQKKVNAKSLIFKIITIATTIFMVLNIAFTILSLHREGERAVGIPPQSVLDERLDEWFPDEFLHERFHNMTVDESVGKD